MGYTTADMKAVQRVLGLTQLPRGIGDGPGEKEISACSIAAINLALFGVLTDEIPDCMSLVLGDWIIRAQDAMSHEARNDRRWRDLLPLAAGSGRDREKERLQILLQFARDHHTSNDEQGWFDELAAEIDAATVAEISTDDDWVDDEQEVWLNLIHRVLGMFFFYVDPGKDIEEIYAVLDKMVAVGWEAEETEERSVDAETRRENLHNQQFEQALPPEGSEVFQAIAGDDEEPA